MKLVKVDFEITLRIKYKNIFELSISNNFIRDIRVLFMDALQESIVDSGEAGDDFHLLCKQRFVILLIKRTGLVDGMDG